MVNVMMIDSREASLRSLVSLKKEEVLSIAGFLTRASSIFQFIHSLIISSIYLVLLLPAWCLDLTAGLCLSI